MGRAITLFASLLAVAALLATACVSTGAPAGFDPLMNQANARMTATAAAAAQTEADVVVTAIAQKTAQARREEFHALTVEAAQANATTQSQADATATIEAQAQATAQSHVEETRMAIEGTMVAATLQAGQSQGTATAEAQRSQATSTAQAQVAGTATAATATAQVENPIATRTAADTAAYVTTKTWEQRMAPWESVGKALFWTAIGLFGFLACLWVFPRAWIALQMRFLRVDDEADGSQWMFVGSKGLIQAWTGKFKATSYNGDRDRGPGQTIDSDREADLLPGSDPRVTERDQFVDALTRPVQVAARGNGTRPKRPSLPTPRWRHAPVAGPARPYRVLQPGTTLPPQVQRVLDHAVVASLDRDWEERDE
ncbi:MAG: hypothetical protein DRJ03_23380 [Chloroflexi bacterium]|nr:MAG: hypothetical protein DRJ03_23380 [Chloroflexota bacterium]